MSIVGEAILSASIQVLFEKLAYPELLQLARREQVHTELKKWEKTLLKIHAVLGDAEEKQMTNQFVRIWLAELRDLAYDVEDILDEFATEALRRKLMAAEPQVSINVKVCNFVQDITLVPCDFMFKSKMGSKMEEISTRLQGIVSQKNDLDLREYAGGRSDQKRERLPKTSLVDESRVYGREKDKEAVVELLLSSEESSNEVSVIPIVGMAGVGKTTLAQLVYNDDKVTGCFDLKAWACVTDDFDVLRITKTILQSLTLETYHVKDLNLLQVKLKEKLSGKRFFIVLDDVWSENYGEWDALCDPFRTGIPGCKIIVTTRNGGVASIMHTLSSYRLKELLYDDCLSIFAKHALGRGNFDSQPNLEVIGKEIVKKCKGLPLAAKTLGGLLRGKKNHDDWETVLNSKIWDLPEERSSIFLALRLSYHHLPSHLKRCYAYCATFPKDYEFDKDELVSLWMAEGLVKRPKGKKQLEDIGSEYFYDLLSRSFFQQSSRNKTQFVMHAFMNDLAQAVAGDICFHLDDNLESSERSTIFENARHASFIRCTYDVSKRFEVFSKMKSLRSLLALPVSASGANCSLSDQVLPGLLPQLTCLRVLSWSGYRITEVPNSICNLEHLRYLNLSYTEIKSLPESVSALFNLQTLLLCGCWELTKLPQGIGNLINLHWLDLTDTYKLQEMPLGIGNLINLQKLPKFIVGKGDGPRINELKGLLHLRGKLTILGLHKVLEIRDARDANLKDKCSLDELVMEWGHGFHNLRKEKDEMHVLDLLQPHRHLKKLTIVSYGGAVFPTWIGDSSFAKLVHLNLRNCRRIISLPSLGQLPSLQDLCIEGMDRVKSVGPEFFGLGSASVMLFPALEILTFKNMLEWEDWTSSTGVGGEAARIFPCLQELEIRNCPKLNGRLPSHIRFIRKLYICKCPQLAYSSLSLPSLRELNIEECKEVVLRSIVDHTSLTTLKIRKLSELACLHEEFLQFSAALEVLEIRDCGELTSLWPKGTGLQNLPCLKQIEIRWCPQLECLAEENQRLPPSLEHLELYNCGVLEKLPCLHSLTYLKDLSIERCPKLVSFPETGLPSMLRHLVLRHCEALDSLPNGVMADSCNNAQCLLEDLEIEWCPSLVSFPRGNFPSTLKSLDIRDCTNLLSLPEALLQDGNTMSTLENLMIKGCPSLTSFPTGKFPPTLKKLKVYDFMQLESLSGRMLQNNTSLQFIYIWNCKDLKSLPECLHSFTHLTELRISDCPALESFPERGFPIPNLRTVCINNCANLKSLPDQMQNLKFLQHLSVFNCPGLVTIPEEGFPRNLTSLEIWNCENLKQSISEWSLHRLTSLQRFSIAGICPPEMVSFPDNECMLPQSLSYIWINKLPNLKSLSMGLLNLPSLEELWIINCPKLQSLPKEGLPTTLGRLNIWDCPLLARGCSKGKGDYWPMIAHIPCIDVDNVRVR